MNIAKSFTFMFIDRKGVYKLAVGAGLACISFLIVPFFMIVGYGIAVARNVRDGQKRPLPEWDFGSMLKDGFVVAVAGFIYSLPATLLVTFGGVLPLVLMLVNEGERSVSSMVASRSLPILVSCVASLYVFALMAIVPAIYIQYIRHGSLLSCFNFVAILNIVRKQLGNIIISILLIAGAGIAFTFFSVFLNVIPCLGQIAWIVVTLLYVPYQQMVTGHLYGQIASNVDNKLY